MQPSEASPLWHQAQTLEELGEVVASWLEHRIEGSSGLGYGIPPNPETSLIAPTLAAVNRSGYITWTSQPGHSPDHPMPHPWPMGVCPWQKACVSGFIRWEIADHLIGLAHHNGLGTIVHYPNDRQAGFEKCVVVNTGSSLERDTLCGYHFSAQDFSYHNLHPSVIQQLLGIVFSSVFTIPNGGVTTGCGQHSPTLARQTSPHLPLATPPLEVGIP